MTETISIFASADTGNHERKIKSTRSGEKTKTLIADSGIQFTREGFFVDKSEKDVFYFKHSSSKFWREKSWYETSKGLHPYELNGTEFCLGDTAKSFLALPSLTSGLWGQLKDGDVIALNATVQNIHTNREHMVKELEGTHTVICNGESKRFTIIKPEIFTEGIGALLVQKPKRDDISMLVDYGGDTIILSFLDGLKLRGSVSVIRGLGVNHFLGLLGGLEETNTLLGRSPHNREELLSIVRGQSEIDFTSALEKAAIKWIEDIKKEVFNSRSYEMSLANNRYAIGGGASIVGVQKALDSFGLKIIVIDNPQMANVTGLHNKLLNQHGVIPAKATTKKAKGEVVTSV